MTPLPEVIFFIKICLVARGTGAGVSCEGFWFFAPPGGYLSRPGSSGRPPCRGHEPKSFELVAWPRKPRRKQRRRPQRFALGAIENARALAGPALALGWPNCWPLLTSREPITSRPDSSQAECEPSHRGVMRRPAKSGNHFHSLAIYGEEWRKIAGLTEIAIE